MNDYEFESQPHTTYKEVTVKLLTYFHPENTHQ